jgi:AcrR family transcriptional regulator
MAKPNVVSKEALIESAKACIVEQGIEKLTLKAVAEGANVTQGTVYYHFRTKEQLMMEIVKNVCQSSWQDVESSPKSDKQKLADALEAARARCTPDSFYHRLFFSLLTYSFQNENTKEQLRTLLAFENESLVSQLNSLWGASPVEGVSMETWGILLNALVDGLAIQALLSDSFPTEKVYRELELILQDLTNKNHSH